MSTQSVDDAFRSVDPLGEALHALRMSGTFYTRSELTAPWGVDLPPMPDCLMFHLVTRGSCLVRFADGGDQRLQTGEFALLPHGEGHVIADDAATEAVDIFALHRELIGPRYELLNHGGGGAVTHLICGAVAVADPAAQRVVSLLPRIITMPMHTPANEWLLSSIRLMMSEAETLRPGGDTIITRVSDILVVQAIRYWLETDPRARTGWLGALHDARIGKAIALVHRRPTHGWTVENLAAAVGMSRSAFAARFQELVGETPMHYVRAWRFAVATSWLKETDLPLAAIATRLDYESEASFHRAYKRWSGQTPGAVRRNARASTPPA